MTKETNTIAAHPCFDKEAKHSHARVHLPVAPSCNIQCNYCNRQFDCVNESRPGVTSTVLKPFQAFEYFRALHDKLDNLSVVGIAGPGDPFANAEETLETMERIKSAYPDKLFCVSTNGLNLFPHIDKLAQVGVSHVTITINAIDPAITASVYKWVRFNKKVYRGIEGAKVLLEQQLKCIPALKEKGIIVKINSVIMPGINDEHIVEVARVCADLGADVFNCIPMIATKGTEFENLKQPDSKMVFKTRMQVSEHIELMSHCSRCRADAAGLLGKDLKDTHVMLKEFAKREPFTEQERPYVAVATREGLLVNMHLGEAKSFYIYRQSPKGFQFVEERAAPPTGTGDNRWLDMAKLMKDCRALLVSGVGENPKVIINSCGTRIIEMTGLIDEGLDGIYNHKPIRSIAKQDAFRCGSNCKGNAQGCA
ncbi:nitrogenase cofactor biosynthesis protein NifB [Natronoflexus pectinivorans]|uniref:FeMo cofactor biosynthesis protein NifB n=1 Tax=Natronoflexus pectinivorans TaxID=682526 RepID=A0A4R2GGM7_9BACT|nr:nitrogenase cofactor biosynthesis protein NifB [Natronoflexus pectinivorans]TCO07136.1 nitrogen fixation protein NifB [Natronoflexus pectinivorans]